VPKRAKREPLTIARLERALLIAARCLELDGPVLLPMYECLEKELEVMRRTEGTMERARQLLAANRHELAELVGGEVKMANPPIAKIENMHALLHLVEMYRLELVEKIVAQGDSTGYNDQDLQALGLHGNAISSIKDAIEFRKKFDAM
jgi:hypothetical protein